MRARSRDNNNCQLLRWQVKLQEIAQLSMTNQAEADQDDEPDALGWNCTKYMLWLCDFSWTSGRLHISPQVCVRVHLPSTARRVAFLLCQYFVHRPITPLLNLTAPLIPSHSHYGLSSQWMNEQTHTYVAAAVIDNHQPVYDSTCSQSLIECRPLCSKSKSQRSATPKLHILAVTSADFLRKFPPQFTGGDIYITAF